MGWPVVPSKGGAVSTDSHTVPSAQRRSKPPLYLSFYPATPPLGACLSFQGVFWISFSLYEPLFIYFLNNQHF